MHCCARPFVDTHKLSRRVPARRPRAAAAFIVSRRPAGTKLLAPFSSHFPSPSPLLPSARKLAGGGLVRYAFSPIVCPARTARQRREHAGLTTLRATKINLGVRDPFATRAIARRHPRFRISRAVACITRGFVGIQDCFPPASRISPGKEETRASRTEAVCCWTTGWLSLVFSIPASVNETVPLWYPSFKGQRSHSRRAISFIGRIPTKRHRVTKGRALPPWRN